MPLNLAFHVGHTLAEHGVRNQHMGLAGGGVEASDCFRYLGNVVPVHLVHIPIKRMPTLGHGREAQYLIGISERLLSVQVNDGDKISRR